jgi:hypothetical protein
MLYVEADVLQQSFRVFGYLCVCSSDHAKRQLKRRRMFNIQLNDRAWESIETRHVSDNAFSKE